MRWMHKHTRSLVDDDQIWIFEDDIQRNILRTHRRLTRHVQMDLDEISDAESSTDIFVHAVDLAFSVPNDLAQIHPTDVRISVEKKILESHIALGCLDHEFMSVHSEDSKLPRTKPALPGFALQNQELQN